MVEEFRLIVPTKPSGKWSGGWAAGSVNAHYFHYDKFGKVLWFQYFQKKGFGKYLDDVNKNWDYLRKNPGKSKLDVSISDTGYFYQNGSGDITWQFRLEKIIENDEIQPEEMKYIPPFRQIYYKEAPEYERQTYWFLISKMEKFKKPLRCLGTNNFKTYGRNSRRAVSLTGSHIRNNGFVCVFPSLNNDALFKPKLEELKDLHLKEWFIDSFKGKKNGFHESNIQDAILMDLLSEGYVFSKEGVIKSKKTESIGRYDFLIKDQKDDNYYAIETKLDNDVGAPDQLEEYIDAIVENGDIPRNKIKGIIICGRYSEETEKRARAKGFKIYNYELDLNIRDFLKGM